MFHFLGGCLIDLFTFEGTPKQSFVFSHFLLLFVFEYRTFYTLGKALAWSKEGKMVYLVEKREKENEVLGLNLDGTYEVFPTDKLSPIPGKDSTSLEKAVLALVNTTIHRSHAFAVSLTPSSPFFLFSDSLAPLKKTDGSGDLYKRGHLERYRKNGISQRSHF